MHNILAINQQCNDIVTLIFRYSNVVKVRGELLFQQEFTSPIFAIDHETNEIYVRDNETFIVLTPHCKENSVFYHQSRIFTLENNYVSIGNQIKIYDRKIVILTHFGHIVIFSLNGTFIRKINRESLSAVIVSFSIWNGIIYFLSLKGRLLFSYTMNGECLYQQQTLYEDWKQLTHTPEGIPCLFNGSKVRKFIQVDDTNDFIVSHSNLQKISISPLGIFYAFNKHNIFVLSKTHQKEIIRLTDVNYQMDFLANGYLVVACSKQLRIYK
jgi:hypothetical protein